ncbi:hypothetical protein A2480_01545 [Candidatus Uhrbacteria bacterium RIFOXYC2_FULL_47_19]|uniref:Uncharacterized protein n=1 Tax=Candidatus Uhrbacteria bacterium RIFOXYC2_FULL_47_19 TaxID=1802424 RepID=A0A1F7WFL7_9BACT|nr:MAG: hypothetical protein A2480_01545 [Candidatus Uhrbacteria bacterium RIFOXYC2_FULL_47_19]
MLRRFRRFWKLLTGARLSDGSAEAEQSGNATDVGEPTEEVDWKLRLAERVRCLPCDDTGVWIDDNEVGLILQGLTVEQLATAVEWIAEGDADPNGDGVSWRVRWLACQQLVVTEASPEFCRRITLMFSRDAHPLVRSIAACGLLHRFSVEDPDVLDRLADLLDDPVPRAGMLLSDEDFPSDSDFCQLLLASTAIDPAVTEWQEVLAALEVLIKGRSPAVPAVILNIGREVIDDEKCVIELSGLLCEMGLDSSMVRAAQLVSSARLSVVTRIRILSEIEFDLFEPHGIGVVSLFRALLGNGDISGGLDVFRDMIENLNSIGEPLADELLGDLLIGRYGSMDEDVVDFIVNDLWDRAVALDSSARQSLESVLGLEFLSEHPDICDYCLCDGDYASYWWRLLGDGFRSADADLRGWSCEIARSLVRDGDSIVVQNLAYLLSSIEQDESVSLEVRMFVSGQLGEAITFLQQDD